jgi:hypothetical protein
MSAASPALSFVRHLVAAVLAAAAAVGLAGERDDSRAVRAAQPGFEFQVTLEAEAMAAVSALGLETPIDGRLFIIVSRKDSPEPREQTGLNGVPLWGVDVTALVPQRVVRVTDDEPILGFPLERLADLPAGRYYVQALLNVYTTFRRADGHVLKLHQEMGEGQDLWRAPGNVVSGVQEIEIGGGVQPPVRLALSRTIPPIEPLGQGDVAPLGNPKDTAQVKFVKMQSRLLSEFWGRPMYLGANVLLPAGYDAQPELRYPTLYLQGHFPGRNAPLGYLETGESSSPRASGFSQFWQSDDAPRMIVVTIRDANPYYDTSYSVNSANVGPYGDAITRELMPLLEQRFRMIPEPWARVLAGGSTGGWEAVAMQIFYPDLFGGAWGWCPDSLDFRYHQIVNVYEDENAYVQGSEWVKVERPNARRPDGNVTSTIRQESRMEQAMGSRNRSGGQWAIWEAVYGPVATDGYPQPIWDPDTGRLDKEVAAYWRNHFDLRAYVEREWPRIGPLLSGKIHIAVGDMDTYYLEQGVYLFEEMTSRLQNPPAAVSFEYGRRKPHCWIGASRERPGEDLTNAEFVQIVGEYLAARAPEGADLRWRPRGR